MNTIFVTQGDSLNLFYAILQSLQSKYNLKKVGIYVSGSTSYLHLKKKKPNIESEFIILKEWELTSNFNNIQSTNEVLSKYESRTGNLWDPIILDRRLTYGDTCKYEQNYNKRYTHTQQKKIIAKSLINIDTFINEIDPDFIVSFIPCTFGSYIIYSFAKEKRIPYLNLRSTKIFNYSTLSEDIYENPNHIYRLYKEKKLIKRKNLNLASDYINSLKSGTTGYEDYNELFNKKGNYNFKSFINFLLMLGIDTLHYYCTVRSKDNYNLNPIRSAYHTIIRQKLYAKIQYRYLSTHCISSNKLNKLSYLFYPLHTEPEIALSLLGREHLNQVELVRNIARSLPINMKIIIKEHPRQFGCRKIGYYKKLLNISNVSFADPSMPPYILIQNADLVATVSGHAGFEAAIMGKPVITFGSCVYNILPNVYPIHTFNNLYDKVKEILTSYEYNEKDIKYLIGAILQGSAPISLYGNLLTITDGYNNLDKFRILMEYLSSRLDEVLKRE